MTPTHRDIFLRALRDIAADDSILDQVKTEVVFENSLMRKISLSVIYGQYRRVLEGNPVLTDFHFSYRDPGDEQNAPISLHFDVQPGSRPLTNIHVLIGRNGVGKTTLLNNMVDAIISLPGAQKTLGRFYTSGLWTGEVPISPTYFSCVVTVSFSAFDPFVPPTDQRAGGQRAGYYYIGMKQRRIGSPSLPPKTEDDLIDDFVKSLGVCFGQPAKRARWLSAIKSLESDGNFSDMELGNLAALSPEAALTSARSLAKRMSSGHSIVLLTLTKLIDSVEEKTLVLMDEPESHLHPPLLSAFMRALSSLLQNRNGVAIVATHSPVVVQETPRSCVWKLTRLRTAGRTDRPETETFGENVGVLTREIFGLEVSKAGFHAELEQAVQAGGGFDAILAEYKEQLGFEAQGILRSLIASRDATVSGSR